MQNGLTPKYLSSLVPDNLGNNSAYNLRNARNLNTIQANSQLYFRSFLPSVTRDWNGLSEEIRNSTSLSSFKRHLNSSRNVSPKFFFDGKRPGQIYHARLRMRCSSLNAHLFSKISLTVLNASAEHLKIHITSYYLAQDRQFYDKNL